MHFNAPHWKLLLCALILSQAKGQQQPTYKSLVEKTGKQLSNSQQRAALVSDLRALSSNRLAEAQARATAAGLKTEWVGPTQRRAALVGYEGDRPRYLITHNANAAISTGANLLQATPYSVTGTGFTVGVWDGGTVLANHQELAGRVTLKDPVDNEDHATHVAGTIAAVGVKAAAKGMAPSVRIDSYDWFNDVSELTDRAASYPGEPSKLYISNHSYGLISGWDSSQGIWLWYGNGTTATSVEGDFGRYSDDSAADDSLAYNAPYFLMFRSAGNERTDNPSPGDLVVLNSSGTTVSYNASLHPKGDGVYHNGFENISADALAKNVMTVGAVNDAVNGTKRDPSKAAMSSFSSWGPTDDGRIKPDVVANGVDLYSSVATSTTSYDTYSGTSMASPNAAGSSLLLIQYYNKLFPGQYMRASTLKGLIIHTCSDLGNPGPDYKYGWGLVDVKSAADIITDYSTNTGKKQISENQLNSQIVSRTETFTWDGTSPIRATLSWSDPAGDPTLSTDSRVPRLINDLNLKIIGPDGTTYLPYVMPFVGTWTVDSMDAAAVTGVNHTDNVEQVYISAPTVPGDYQVVVDYSGSSLSGGSQTYSLIMTGNAVKPLAPLAVTDFSPQTISGSAQSYDLVINGSGILMGAQAYLQKSGSSNLINIGGLQVNSTGATGHLNSVSLTSGTYTLIIKNADGQQVNVAPQITVDGSLWSETFEGTVSGWQTSSTGMTNTWSLNTVTSHSATHSYRGGVNAHKTSNSIQTPAIAIPANGANLTFSFWHSLNFTSGDGGALELSIDNGTTWVDVAAAGSGASFVSGGYTTTLPSDNQIGKRPAWNTNGGGFTQVVVALDSAKFAGKSIKARFRAGGNDDSNASTNAWAIDDLALNGQLVTVNYSDWATAQFPDPADPNAAEEGDYDGDGLTNFVEFMMGTDPKAYTPQPATVVNADGSITMSFTQVTNTEAVITHAEYSSDLLSWKDLPVTVVGTSAANPLIQNKKATLPGGDAPKFMRLRFNR